MSDDAAVLAEIARLSSAIEQHKNAPPPPSYSFRGSGRGRGRGRGGAPRGGGSYRTAVIPHRNATWVAPGLQPSRSGTTTPVEPVASTSASRPITPAMPVAGLAVAGGGTTPVRKGMSELNVKGKAPEREVIIDGVVFVADGRGRKLVRKPDAVPSTSVDNPPSPSLGGTPKRTNHLGTTYIRTKNGNLVSLAFARQRKEREEAMRAKGERLNELVGVIGGVQNARKAASGGRGGRGRGRGRGGFAATRRDKPAKPKSDKPCRFFQRTGQCARAHICPYVHDSTHIAICPLFLRSSCPRSASTCPLSHTPNAHRSPHCSHFPSCTRGEACPYAHVVVGKEATVCHEFVDYGWCPRGGECEQRHVRECWRFAETGECGVKGCKEPHVLRRKHDADEEDDEDDDEEEGGEIEGGGFALGAVDDEEAGSSKRKRRESTDGGAVGISGAAGRRLKKLKQRSSQASDFGQQDDFVELMVPLSDDDGSSDDEEEDEEGMSVDSDDLEEEDEDEAEEDEEEGAVEAASPPSPDLLEQVHLAKKDPPPALAAVTPGDGDELDYGLSEDEDDALEIEQMLRR